MGLKSIPPAEEIRFSSDHLRRMLAVSPSQFRAWQRAGLIDAPRPPTTSSPLRTRPKKVARPSTSGAATGAVTKAATGAARNKDGYSAADLLALKTLLRLRKGGVPMRKLRVIHVALKQRFGALGIRRPFSEMQLSEQDQHVLVTFRGTRMEPLTGQLLLDYTGIQSSAPVALAARGSATKPGKSSDRKSLEVAVQRAERFFLSGLREEQTLDGRPKAIRAYRRAIELNPQALGALLNLGTLYYNLERLPEAEQCYRDALKVNPRSALAHFNMGNLSDETGQTKQAIEHYEQAIAIDPRYPDPRYNLALVYEKLGRHGQAWKNWRAYLRLDPDSKWAALARHKLAVHPWQSWQLLRSPQPSGEAG